MIVVEPNIKNIVFIINQEPKTSAFQIDQTRMI